MKLVLATFLVVMATPACAEWQLAQSKHFAVYSEGPPDKARAVAARLERFDKAVRVALKLPDPETGPNARVTIFVTPSIDDVRRIMGLKGTPDFYQSQSPAGAFGFFPQKNENDQSRLTPTPLMVLQHNYTHQILYSTWGDTVMPIWLSEGFAEFFATTRSSPDGSMTVGALPEYRWDGVDESNMFSSDRLIADSPDYADHRQAQTYFGRSWLLIDYMVFNPERAKLLAAYIAALKSGKPAGEAGRMLDPGLGLDIKMNTYGTRATWRSATLSPDQLMTGDITTCALTAGEAAVMPARMRSRAAGATAAQDVLVQARALAAPFPNDAGAQNELAQAEYDAGNFALSEAASERALAADKGSVEAMIHLGQALTALAAKAGNTDPAVWTTARRWFLAANKADPLYFYPVQLYYSSFRTANQSPAPAARKALLYAYTLNITNVTIRWEAARLLLEDGATESARVALFPIAFGESGGTRANAARKVLAALDARDPAAALAVLGTSK